MGPDYKVLNAEEWSRAHQVISAWKNDPGAELACPRCGHAGLAIEDQSVRPYAEWFQLSCGQCGLEVSVHLPQAPPMQTPV
jgi:transcription elongation factor Elf1